MIASKTINTVERPDRRVASTLADAFQDDPALAWIIPDPETRRRRLPHFFSVVAEQSHRHGAVLASSGCEAASLWYPAGDVRDQRMWDALRLLAIFKTALPRGLQVAAAMHERHPQPQPHVYLRYVGVSPAAQGQGWGGAIIRDGITRASKAGLGVLLETATQSNVAIYSRLGFEITSEWTVPGNGPRFWTMVRSPD